MRRLKFEPANGRRLRLPHFLLLLAALYLIFITVKFPSFLEMAASLSGDETSLRSPVEEGEDVELSKPFLGSVYDDTFHRKLEDNPDQDALSMPEKESVAEEETNESRPKVLQPRYGRIMEEMMRRRNRTVDQSVLQRMADEAWSLGQKAWEDAQKFDLKEPAKSSIIEGTPASCPSWVSLEGEELTRGERLMFLPCGLAAGSSITVVGTPRNAHQEYVPQLAKLRGGNAMVMVSQFMVELQGLKVVDGEEPPRILHLNPRLRGDWSHRPVIEHNTCYRMQWGTAQRCDGLRSKSNEEQHHPTDINKALSY
ncbi:hypothetical protein CRG98_047115 [Punica granatum]|uniref:Galectin n=1 Tax=Punica granatum TaxID=22663 RepID=A0A2I0HLF4_PUNGR|nr:hypothetical protein CRG98_047115 [Punica granatum]